MLDHLALYDVPYLIASGDGREDAAFLKLRVRGGEPIDPKAYLRSGVFFFAKSFFVERRRK